MNDMHEIIDKDNNVITIKKKVDITSDDMLRYVHIYIFDDDNNIVLQQRAKKGSRANLIDPSAAGKVDVGETFEQAAHRELKEEIGIETELKYVCDSWGDYGLCKVYKGIYNGEFSPSEREVQHLDKISFFEMVRLHKRYPYIFINGFNDSFERYLETIYTEFDLVDDNDEVIGTCRYEEMCEKKLSVRVAYVIVRNKKGELLLQHRSENVAMPWRLDSAATGHVDTGETYKQAAMREAKEELGIDIDLQDVEPMFYEKLTSSGKFYQVFVVDHEGPFIIEKDEVANVAWLNLDELGMMLEKTPFLFIDSFDYIHDKYTKFIKEQETN